MEVLTQGWVAGAVDARRAEQLRREERCAKRKARMVHRSTPLVVALGGSVMAYCVVRIRLGRLAHPPGRFDLVVVFKLDRLGQGRPAELHAVPQQGDLPGVGAPAATAMPLAATAELPAQAATADEEGVDARAAEMDDASGEEGWLTVPGTAGTEEPSYKWGP